MIYNKKSSLTKTTKSLGEIKNELLISVKSGIISSDTAQQIMLKAEREFYLSMHKYAITCSTTGYWMTYLPSETSKNGRTKKRSRTKEGIEDIVVEYWKNSVRKPFYELIPEWIEYKRQLGMKRNKFKQQTYDRYMTDFHRFFDGTEMLGQDVELLTPLELEEFIIERIDTLDLTSKAYAGLRILLRGSLNYYVKRGNLCFSPEDFFRGLDLRPFFADKMRKQQFFTDREVSLIKEYIQTHKESVISYGILFAFYTGLRVGEIASLKWEDVTSTSVFVHRTEERIKSPDGKGTIYQVRDNPKTNAGIRHVILPPQAQGILQNVRKMTDGEYVFSNDQGERIRADSYTNKLYRICKKVGIEPRSMHKARKTYASLLFRNHVDEALIIDQMGHMDINTTKEFYRWNTAQDEASQKAIYNAVNY